MPVFSLNFFTFCHPPTFHVPYGQRRKSEDDISSERVWLSPALSESSVSHSVSWWWVSDIVAANKDQCTLQWVTLSFWIDVKYFQNFEEKNLKKSVNFGTLELFKMIFNPIWLLLKQQFKCPYWQVLGDVKSLNVINKKKNIYELLFDRNITSIWWVYLHFMFSRVTCTFNRKTLSCIFAALLNMQHGLWNQILFKNGFVLNWLENFSNSLSISKFVSPVSKEAKTNKWKFSLFHCLTEDRRWIRLKQCCTKYITLVSSLIKFLSDSAKLWEKSHPRKLFWQCCFHPLFTFFKLELSPLQAFHMWEKCPAGCWFISKIISPHWLHNIDLKF